MSCGSGFWIQFGFKHRLFFCFFFNWCTGIFFLCIPLTILYALSSWIRLLLSAYCLLDQWYCSVHSVSTVRPRRTLNYLLLFNTTLILSGREKLDTVHVLTQPETSAKHRQRIRVAALTWHSSDISSVWSVMTFTARAVCWRESKVKAVVLANDFTTSVLSCEWQFIVMHVHQN